MMIWEENFFCVVFDVIKNDRNLKLFVKCIVVFFLGLSCLLFDREKVILEFLEWVRKYGVDTSVVEIISFFDCGYGL